MKSYKEFINEAKLPGHADRDEQARKRKEESQSSAEGDKLQDARNGLHDSIIKNAKRAFKPGPFERYFEKFFGVKFSSTIKYPDLLGNTVDEYYNPVNIEAQFKSKDGKVIFNMRAVANMETSRFGERTNHSSPEGDPNTVYDISKAGYRMEVFIKTIIPFKKSYGIWKSRDGTNRTANNDAGLFNSTREIRILDLKHTDDKKSVFTNPSRIFSKGQMNIVMKRFKLAWPGQE